MAASQTRVLGTTSIRGPSRKMRHSTRNLIFTEKEVIRDKGVTSITTLTREERRSTRTDTDTID